MSDINELCDDLFKLTIKDENNNKLYNAQEVAKLLSLKNISTSLKSFTKDDKVLIKTNTNGGEQNVIHFTLIGLKKLLSLSRKPKALEIAKHLGLDIYNCKIESYEATTVLQIQRAFQGEEMIHQYYVDKYMIDLYFPKYKLAIECDEQFHDKQKIMDKIREDDIIEKLNCTFIRYNPTDTNFNIFKVINEIYTYIKTEIVS